ncbi:MAG: substrate-binding domain-containing protein [Proteobacteria bacterium]|nr:substrate-binding domain-containing protein [Pseudomonadota bacterium]
MDGRGASRALWRAPLLLGLAAIVQAAGLGPAADTTPAADTPRVAAAQDAATRPADPWDERLYPPWQHGANNDAVERGLTFTVPDADNLADFHGDPRDPLLALYVGGNYFFAMAPLVKTFEAQHPQYRGRLYWETLPPGLLVQQIKAGGRITVGNMSWTVKPDVYLAGLSAVQRQIDAGLLSGPALPYVTNTLTIMVPRGNPGHVSGLADLARPGLLLAMPNPEFEGVARQITESLTKAGGESLARTVYDSKVKDGTTRLTRIHHRQTPLWLMQGRAQAGVTWQSEALFQEQVGHPISHVDIPPQYNTSGVYAAAVVRGAAHETAARLWLDFIRSPEGLAIFERYGFKRFEPGTPK